jgi:putative DNA methylase
MPTLTPFALKDAPSLIESVFPSQKVSFEAQRERKAGAGQTLTALGSYWKGRKPLILVRAIVLGALLPQTQDTEQDLEVFDKLMAFDDEGLARRAFAKNGVPAKLIASRLELTNPWDYFTYSVKKGRDVTAEEVDRLTFPIDPDNLGISVRWKRELEEDQQTDLIRRTLLTWETYEERAALAARPEEVDQEWLYCPVWATVNEHLGQYGVEAHSIQELVEQMGILRFGKRPKVGDTFSGGGSIPFEAARMGCDVYASDLNPIAAMLTWGALNIIGASPERRAEIERQQQEVADAVDREITELGIEHDKDGNRAKAYLYCLETRCPETGWMVPLAPSWIISKTRNCVARLVPDYGNKRFDIDVVTGVSDEEMEEASRGTVQDGFMVYRLDGVTHRTSIKTIRGDYRDAEGRNRNRLRPWLKTDFKPAPDDIFQERLYAIQWITKNSLEKGRPETFFASVSEEDLYREEEVEQIVRDNLTQWQDEGLVPDMEIEPGYNTDQPIRERGWSHWHHLFTARQLHFFSLLISVSQRCAERSESFLNTSKALDRSSKLCRWTPGSPGRVGVAVTAEKVGQVFDNQALNPILNYGSRTAYELLSYLSRYETVSSPLESEALVKTKRARETKQFADYWITDPPYADAVNYEEITEFFIAWLRKNPPPPFDQWTWDSRRALAIKGDGDDFRRGMVDAYKAMTEHMPDNGMQVVMFTHQDTGVWSDMVGIFWAAGLQVVSAWYIATETTSELKKGGYVQGTVILVLRKRADGERTGFKQRILPAVRDEVSRQISEMMHLNENVASRVGQPVFNDSDLQMAGYAAALKVLTGYTQIGGEDVRTFALRPRRRNETTVVDEMVQQASETANSVLVPEGLSRDTWQRLSGVQRFFLRMLDMETTGASKLDNYQNFAKAFRVEDYPKVMGSMTANKARLKRVSEFASRDLSDATEVGPTWLGRIIMALQQLQRDTDPQVIVSQLQIELPDFIEVRPILIDILLFLSRKAGDAETREAAEILSARLRNMRAFGE